MRATDFEYRHQLLLHELIVGAAVLTYLVDPNDVVWRLIKGGTHVRFLERAAFAVATLVMGISAGLCTFARGSSEAAETGRIDHSERFLPWHRLRYVGEFLYALALGSLVPLSGFLILTIGEALRLLRLYRRHDQTAPIQIIQGDPAKHVSLGGARALRVEALKWGLFFTMIVFTVTLKDRVAEVMIALSILLWLILNVSIFRASREAAAP